MTTASDNGSLSKDVRKAAAHYLGLGRAPVPVYYRTKVPVGDAWQGLRPTLDSLDELFPAGESRNLGLLLGSPSRGLIDGDLDCAEAIRAAPHLLPETGWVSGRKSKPRSHWWYTSDSQPGEITTYRDLDGTMLAEFRSSGQTVAPPGIHETGEPIEWEIFTEPAHVDAHQLRAAIGAVAAASLLARRWPREGSRQDAVLALCGGLARANWDADRISKFVTATVTAAGDPDLNQRLTAVEGSIEKAQAGEKVRGWPKLAALLGDPVVSRAREWLGLSPAPTALSELPLPEPPPWPDPPAEEAFYGLAGKIVCTIEPASEADRAALLVQTLVAFGSVTGRSAHFTVEADRHHGNEFAVLVGRTSKARKGTSWGRVFRLFREAEGRWAADRVQTGASSGEGLIWAVRDPVHKRERVKERGEVVRYEEVEADPGVEDKRLLVYEPEFANVLKQTERQGNTLSAVLRQAWDGLDLRTLTKNSPARATGAHVSLIGHITADELRRYLTETETANGYGNRHLWICADRSKLLPEGGSVDPEAWEALRQELAEALAFAQTAGEMTRDEEARAIWREVYGSLSEGKPGLAGALLARAEAHVMRLALIYALLDRSVLIRAQHLLAALALWDYAERSVYFVFGDNLGDPIADDLLRLLRTCPNGLTRNELRDYLGRHQSSDRVGRALGLLLQHRLARCEREETGGRPAERWFAVARGKQS